MSARREGKREGQGKVCRPTPHPHPSPLTVAIALWDHHHVVGLYLTLTPSTSSSQGRWSMSTRQTHARSKLGVGPSGPRESP